MGGETLVVTVEAADDEIPKLAVVAEGKTEAPKEDNMDAVVVEVDVVVDVDVDASRCGAKTLAVLKPVGWCPPMPPAAAAPLWLLPALDEWTSNWAGRGDEVDGLDGSADIDGVDIRGLSLDCMVAV